MQRIMRAGASYGAIRNNRTVAGCVLNESRYESGHVSPAHAHEQAYFYTVLRGVHRDTFDSRTLHPKPLSLVFHPASQIHSHRCETETGVSLFNIEIAPEWHSRLGDDVTLSNAAHFDDAAVAILTRRLYREFLATDAAAPLAIESLLLEMVACIARKQLTTLYHSGGAPPLWLQHARDLLHAHFRDDLSINAIANAVGIHPVHLARTFRRQYHSTIGDYIRRLRVEYSAERLASSPESLSEVALDAGFADQSHFSRSFRRIMGVTPGEFRRTTMERRMPVLIRS